MAAPGSRMLFVAGATGVTGRAVIAAAKGRGIAVVPHVRPRHEETLFVEPAARFELTDRPALVAALAGATTVLQLIGTMRRRFASGDTYETSDVGTTRLLAEAARAVGTIDHVVLLSSVGAGSPRGAYLRAKAAAEIIVRESGIPFTIVRPSFLLGDRRGPPSGVAFATRLLGPRYRAIPVERLAGLLLDVASARAPLGAALEGKSLWDLVAPGSS